MEAQLYEALTQKLKECLPACDLRVQKTQITFVNPRVFACVSLRWKNGIVVTFGLPHRVDSPRIHEAVEVRVGRWTHHVKVQRTDEIDQELMAWLQAAWLFSAGR